MWVAVDLSPGSAMFLMRGWKYFTRSKGLGPGHLLHFLFDSSAILSMQFFGATSICLECCAKSSSVMDIDSFSDNDDDDNVFSTKLEGDDSK
ncbi:hypothetical protein D1007_33409 [Hordeum vulgare]|nr:hypothetical protein D1007_33409 [Hordeum vulgare]